MQRDRPTDLIYVYLGSGVIAGLVIDGQLCFGRDGLRESWVPARGGRRALTEAAHKLDITLSHAGEESGATGAATLWINRMLATPFLLLGDERSADA